MVEFAHKYSRNNLARTSIMKNVARRRLFILSFKDYRDVSKASTSHCG